MVKGELVIHVGYYNFVYCIFDKWTLDYKKTKVEGRGNDKD